MQVRYEYNKAIKGGVKADYTCYVGDQMFANVDTAAAAEALCFSKRIELAEQAEAEALAAVGRVMVYMREHKRDLLKQWRGLIGEEKALELTKAWVLVRDEPEPELDNRIIIFGVLKALHAA